MNIEEFSYEFNSNGVENLISKLKQMEYETNQLDEAASHLTSTFGKLFDTFLKSSVPPAFIKLIADQAMAFSKQAAYLDKLSQTSGISARNIQQLGYALYKFGGDTDVATRSLTSLKAKIDQLKEFRKKGREGFSELFTIKRKYGMSLVGADDPMTLLKQIAATMDKLSKDKQLKFAKALGLDDATFLMVKKGIKSVEEELYKAQKYILFDEKDIQTSVKFEDTIKEIGADIELISKSFSFGALPQLQKFSDKIKSVTNYLSEHPEVIKGLGLVTFSAGAMGVLRLLEAVPTKFLAGTAAVTAFGTAVGMANEEIKRIDETGSKEGTLLGALDEDGLKGTSKAVEQIFRALSKFGEFKFLDGFKELDNIWENIIAADTEGTDPLSSFAEGVIDTKNKVSEVVGELKDAIKESGIEEDAQKWLNQGLDFVEKGWNKIEETAPEILDKALDEAEKTLDKITNAIEKSGIQEEISKSIDSISKYGGELWDTLKKSYEKMGKNDFSADSIETEIVNVYKKIKTDVVGVYNNIKAKAPTYIEEAKKKGVSLYEEIKTNIVSTYDELKTKAAPYVNSAKKIAVDLYEELKSGIKSTYDHLKKEAPGYIDTVKKEAIDIYNTIKTNVIDIYNKVSTESAPFIEQIKKDAIAVYDQIKTDVVSLYNHLEANAPAYLESAKKTIKELYKSIKDQISDWYNQLTDPYYEQKKNNPNFDETKVPQLKNQVNKSLKDFFIAIFDILKDAVASLPAWVKNALSTGLKTFIVTWFATGFDTQKAGIAAALMGVRSAINTKIEEGDEDAEILKQVYNDSMKGYAKGYALSLGDKDVANKYALSAIADSFAENADKFKNPNIASPISSRKIKQEKIIEVSQRSYITLFKLLL